MSEAELDVLLNAFLSEVTGNLNAFGEKLGSDYRVGAIRFGRDATLWLRIDTGTGRTRATS